MPKPLDELFGERMAWPTHNDAEGRTVNRRRTVRPLPLDEYPRAPCAPYPGRLTFGECVEIAKSLNQRVEAKRLAQETYARAEQARIEAHFKELIRWWYERVGYEGTLDAMAQEKNSRWYPFLLACLETLHANSKDTTNADDSPDNL